ncbi:sensor histidine kinase [Pseudoduganella lutea]|uniref:histidine kinase n=1 Tax=Pseudoduganella lutea TaxID=321985 RepID=A0A4P6L4P2_9BURK|nr:PAS domain-containing sensor histidine kinase [Pseudoduganella lutea]QBE65782.1 PAS domain S-box protein [Pseudoduganella lutea]
MAPDQASVIKDSFYLAMEKISDYAVFLTDAAGYITYWNPAAEQMKGYSAAEAIGMHYSMLYSPDARERGEPERNLQRAAAQGTYQEQALRQTKDGRMFWAMTELIAIHDDHGQLTRFCKVTRDITAFRRLQARLQEQKQKVEVTLESIGDGVISVDPVGHIGFVNRKAEEITGWSSASAQGREVGEVLHVVDPALQRPNESDLLRAASASDGAAVVIVEHPLGGRKIIENVTTPVCLPDGEKLGEVMVIRDVTQREADAQLMRDAERNKDHFLATLAHELRNPLAPILSAAQLLEAGPGGEQARQMGRIITRQARHILSLVEDLLDVSRVAQGKVHLDIGAHPIQPIVTSAIEQIQPMLEQKGHHLTVNMDDEPLLAICDRERMVQVIANLLNNAVRYTNAGGHICIDLRADKEQLELSVTDDGIGIASDMLPRVFDLFAQEKRASDKSRSGLGIGLALVKNMVELQAGEVHCYSRGKGHGSRFAIKLQRHAEAEPTL